MDGQRRLRSAGSDLRPGPQDKEEKKNERKEAAAHVVEVVRRD